MEYYQSSFLNAVPRLTAEYKKLAKEQGIELQHPKTDYHGDVDRRRP